MTDRKIFYSFHDIPPGYTNYYGNGLSRSGITFSRKEIYHILIAISVLTIAFSFVFVPYPPLRHITQVLNYFPQSFLAIVTAFFCHEIAHKYVGQKFGYWSEFRMFPQGLLFALFLGITVGILFAAPGAVQIFGRPTREEMGKISVAGPVTNLCLGLVFAGIWSLSEGLISSISFFIAYINVFLAFFNLLPFGPLDGLKILRWKKELWGLLIGIDIIILILLFQS